MLFTLRVGLAAVFVTVNFTNITDPVTKVNPVKATVLAAGSYAAASHAHNYINYYGTNTIKSTTDDTTANWGNKGFGLHFNSVTGQLIDQPSQWGFILNLTSGTTEVYQIWTTQASGNMAHRGGNANGWNGSWRTIYDSVNSNPCLIRSTAPATNYLWAY